MATNLSITLYYSTPKRTCQPTRFKIIEVSLRRVSARRPRLEVVWFDDLLTCEADVAQQAGAALDGAAVDVTAGDRRTDGDEQRLDEVVAPTQSLPCIQPVRTQTP